MRLLMIFTFIRAPPSFAPRHYAMLSRDAFREARLRARALCSKARCARRCQRRRKIARFFFSED